MQDGAGKAALEGTDFIQFAEGWGVSALSLDSTEAVPDQVQDGRARKATMQRLVEIRSEKE